MKKTVERNVIKLVEKIKEKPSTKFNEKDFKYLVYAIISDKEFKTKKFFIKANEMLEEEVCIAEAMDKFLDKFLKHIGIDEPERSRLISTFEYDERDVDFMIDLIEEAYTQYIDAGKSIKMFKDKKLQLALKKVVRTGKYEGKVTYKKTVVDKDAKLIKLKEKAAQAQQ